MVKAIVGQKMPKMPKFNLSALYSPIEKFGEKIGIIGIFPKRAKRASPPKTQRSRGGLPSIILPLSYGRMNNVW